MSTSLMTCDEPVPECLTGFTSEYDRVAVAIFGGIIIAQTPLKPDEEVMPLPGAHKGVRVYVLRRRPPSSAT